MEAVFCVVGDERKEVRGGFVCTKEEYDEKAESYDGYFIVASFDYEDEALEYCEKYNNYEDDTSIYVIDDTLSDTREAFLANAKDAYTSIASYSGYEIIETFTNHDEAANFCDRYNHYSDTDTDWNEGWSEPSDDWGE